MNLQNLQQQIKNNELDDLYIFTGEEIAVQKIYIDKIGQLRNLEIEYADGYKQILNKLYNNDLFGTKKIYVIINDEDILKQENVWQDINTNGNIIIFKYINLDKRGKFYKQFEDRIVEFNKLSNELLIKYIQKEIPDLLEVNCEKLIYICDNNYNQILLELDKIKNYKLATNLVEDICFCKLDNERSIL